MRKIICEMYVEPKRSSRMMSRFTLTPTGRMRARCFARANDVRCDPFRKIWGDC